MDRQSIIEYVGERFNESPWDDDGSTVDIYNSYGWQAGCYHGDTWVCLAEIVELIEHICEEEGVFDE